MVALHLKRKNKFVQQDENFLEEVANCIWHSMDIVIAAIKSQDRQSSNSYM